MRGATFFHSYLTATASLSSVICDETLCDNG